jgi:hypothetical protein
LFIATAVSLLMSLQLAISQMCVLAIGIEGPLLMPMDRLQHSHLSEDHRSAALRSLRHDALRSAPSPFCVLTRNFLRELVDSFAQGAQLAIVREQYRFVKTSGPGHNET